MILRIFHAPTPLIFNNALKLYIFGLDTHCEMHQHWISYDRELFGNKQPATGARIYSIKWNTAHIMGLFARCELSFSKAFAVEAQIVLNISVIVSMQLDAVSPLFKYLVQMYNLLVVK